MLVRYCLHRRVLNVGSFNSLPLTLRQRPMLGYAERKTQHMTHRCTKIASILYQLHVSFFEDYSEQQRLWRTRSKLASSNFRAVFWKYLQIRKLSRISDLSRNFIHVRTDELQPALISFSSFSYVSVSGFSAVGVGCSESSSARQPSRRGHVAEVGRRCGR